MCLLVALLILQLVYSSYAPELDHAWSGATREAEAGATGHRVLAGRVLLAVARGIVAAAWVGVLGRARDSRNVLAEGRGRAHLHADHHGQHGGREQHLRHQHDMVSAMYGGQLHNIIFKVPAPQLCNLR